MPRYPRGSKPSIRAPHAEEIRVYTQAALTSMHSRRKMCQIDRRTVICYDLGEMTCKLDERKQINPLIMLRLRRIDHALHRSSPSFAFLEKHRSREKCQVSAVNFFFFFYSDIIFFFPQKRSQFVARVFENIDSESLVLNILLR